MKINFAAVSCLSMLFLSLVQVPIAKAQPTAGDQELQVSGTFFRPVGQGGGNFNGDLSYGVYFNDPAWQLGVRQGYNHIFGSNQDDIWNLTTVPFLDYHILNMGSLVPFVGGFAGAAYNDDDITGTAGPEGGIKAFIGTNTFVGLKYRYEWFFDELETDDIRDTSDASHVVSISLGYLWGGSDRSSVAN